MSAAEAIPGVFAVLTQDDVPDVRFGPFVQDRTLFARDVVRFEGEILAAVAASTCPTRAAGVERHRRRVRAAPCGERHRGGTLRRRAAGAPRLGFVRCGRRRWCATATMRRTRRSPRATSTPAWPTPTWWCTAATWPTAATPRPSNPAPCVAQWEGNKVTIWTSDAGAVRRPRRRVRDARVAGQPGAHHRAPPRRRLRRQVRLPLRGPRRRAGPSHEATGAPGLQPPRGVRRTRPPPRGHRLRPADRREATTARSPLARCGWPSTTAPTPPTPASSASSRAMHALGPYRMPNAFVEAHLVYTNHQPSGSVRAPTAPQTCWAVESAHRRGGRGDRHGPGGVPREATPSTPASRARAGRCTARSACRSASPRRPSMAGYGQPLPDDEAIGVAIGWWPSFSVPSGAYVKIDGDGSGQIITGAQECGTGAVMTLRQLVADELGMQRRGLRARLPGHQRRPVRHGRHRLADAVQQRPRRAWRPPVRSPSSCARWPPSTWRPAPPTSCSPTAPPRSRARRARSVSIAELAGIAAGGELLIGHGSGAPPAATCAGRLDAASATSAWAPGSHRSSRATRCG